MKNILVHIWWEKVMPDQNISWFFQSNFDINVMWLTYIGLVISMFNRRTRPLNVKTTIKIYILCSTEYKTNWMNTWYTNVYLCKRNRPLNFFLPWADEDTTSGTSFLSFPFKCWSFSIIKFSECIISFSIFQC